MNGLGTDRRGDAAKSDHITAAYARSAPAGVPYDQLIAIYPSARPMRRLLCVIFNIRFEVRALAAMDRCRADILFKES